MPATELSSLPQGARAPVARYLAWADRLLPGRIVGFYVVGSTALGAFEDGRSDIDFIAAVDGDLTDAEVRRLRAVHLLSSAGSAARALVRGHVMFPGNCNGTYLRRDDLSLPVSEIHPLAAHVGANFRRGGGFDVNPVVWKEFADGGVAVRGEPPERLGLDVEAARLRQWNLDNLESYWRRWATALARRAAVPRLHPTPRWITAWGVLGAPRLHCTIATGEVISKESAGEYALEHFDARWHPIIREGLAYWRHQPADPAFRDRRTRAEETARFVLEVVEDAHRL